MTKPDMLIINRARTQVLSSDQEGLQGVVARRNGRILADMTPQEECAGLHGFRMHSVDDLAVNTDPAIDFRVETFERSDNFNPDKPFLTHVGSRGSDGKDLI